MSTGFGAETTLVQGLDAAMDADRIIAAGLAGDIHWPGRTPGDSAHMPAWALTGTVPSALAGRSPGPRRGPVPVAPQLTHADLAAFF
ncbi:hypothetical protein ACWCXX_30570 [Streptomyces sp. NPDC001732]